MRRTKKRSDPAEKPRFRIEKLEERIAPGKGGFPGNCGPTYYGYGHLNPHGKLVGSWRCRYHH